MKKIQANTFTPLYDEIEDRIRFTINYQDISNRVDFMITRAFIINLLPAADEFILKHYYDDIEVDTIKISVPSSESTDTVSTTDSVNFELFQKDDELLIEVNFSYDTNSKLTIVTFSSSKTVAKAIFNSNSMKQVFDTIKNAIPNFSWGIAHNF
jgi:hypothetical protein